MFLSFFTICFLFCHYMRKSWEILINQIRREVSWVIFKMHISELCIILVFDMSWSDWTFSVNILCWSSRYRTSGLVSLNELFVTSIETVIDRNILWDWLMFFLESAWLIIQLYGFVLVHFKFWTYVLNFELCAVRWLLFLLFLSGFFIGKEYLIWPCFLLFYSFFLA